MKLFYYTLALVLTFKITGFTDEITMKELRSQFNKEIFSISRSKIIDRPTVEAAVSKAAEKIFNNHPLVLKKEAERLLSEIPYCDESLFNGYIIRKKYEFGLSPAVTYGWNPKVVSHLIKTKILNCYLNSTSNGFVNEKVYRLKTIDTQETTIVMVDSLGDIFMAKLKLLKNGLFIPISGTWMQPDPSIIKITGSTDEITMKELYSQFYREILSRARQKFITGEEMKKTAEKIFHPRVLKKEAKRLLSEIPYCDESLFKGYIFRNEFEFEYEFDFDFSRRHVTYITYGWMPKAALSMAKEYIIWDNTNHFFCDDVFYLSCFVNDKVYRLKTNDTQEITMVITSLGDIFLVKFKLSKNGLFIPISGIWLEPENSEKEFNSAS